MTEILKNIIAPTGNLRLALEALAVAFIGGALTAAIDANGITDTRAWIIAVLAGGWRATVAVLLRAEPPKASITEIN